MCRSISRGVIRAPYDLAEGAGAEIALCERRGRLERVPVHLEPGRINALVRLVHTQQRDRAPDVLDVDAEDVLVARTCRPLRAEREQLAQIVPVGHNVELVKLKDAAFRT